MGAAGLGGCIFPDLSGLTTNDSAGDAAPSITSWCASQGTHQLCEDFDESDAIDPAWQRIENPGTLTLATGGSRSAPRSLLATTPKNSDTNVYTPALIQRAWTNVASHAHLDFDMQALTLDPADWGSVFQIFFGSPAAASSLVLTFKSGNVFVRESQFENGSVEHDWQHPDHAFTPSGWFHVSVDVESGPRTVTIAIEGGPTIVESLSATWAAGPPMLQLGVVYSNGIASGWQFQYDDVVFDTL